MRPSVRMGRISGIEIDLHWSVLAIMLLFTWSLAAVTLPALASGYSDGVYWVTAAMAVIVLFSSLLAHELAHSVVARRRGVAVDRITLWLLGGVSQLHGEAATPADELRIAGAGPLMSAALGAGFGVLAFAVWAVGGPVLAVATIGWLGGINIVLALFNLLPGAPLDGGRLLHAHVWRRTGDRAAATVSATRAGTRVGYTLIGLGVAFVLLGDVAGLWFALLGWFLVTAARAEGTHALLEGALANVRVRDVMTGHPMTVPAHTNIGSLVDEWFMVHRVSAFPVVDEHGSVTGLVTLAKVRSLDRASWHRLDVTDVADPRDTVASGAPGEPISALLERMSSAGGGAGRALVFEGDDLVGIVSPTDVQRAVSIAALHPPAPGRAEEASVPS